VNAVADLEMFVLLHSDHGRLTPVWGPRTANGQRLEVACGCGVMFGRWVTSEDVGFDAVLRHAQLTGG
jgi:hypothetical protein